MQTFLITQGRRRIRAKVCDICSNDDCDNCCSENIGDKDLLIDMEANMLERFGGNGAGTVTWTCINC